MLRLALCDDEEDQRARVGAMLQEYAAARPGLAVKLSVFSSGIDLLAAAQESGGFDLYVLDVVMPGLSGIQLGLRLRELGSTGPIIYLTVSPEYAVDSYAARAFYYLMKPIQPQLLAQVLDQAAEELSRRRAACVTVKTRQGLQLARFDQILYVELAGRTLRYHLAGGERLDSITVRKAFAEEIAPLLNDPSFFLCGASYAANLFYVTAVEKDTLRLDGGVRVPLPRGLAGKARQRWQDYWLNGPGQLQG